MQAQAAAIPWPSRTWAPSSARRRAACGLSTICASLSRSIPRTSRPCTASPLPVNRRHEAGPEAFPKGAGDGGILAPRSLSPLRSRARISARTPRPSSSATAARTVPSLLASARSLYKLSITRTIYLKINSNMPYVHFHIVSINTSNGLAAPERNGHLSWFLLAAEALHPSSCATHTLP